MQSRQQFYIDRTEVLEKGIAVFPSIYIIGAAATGKTTAVRMLVEKHPETAAYWFDLGQKSSAFAGNSKCAGNSKYVRDFKGLQDTAIANYLDEEGFLEYLQEAREQMEQKPCWLIFENVQEHFEQCNLIVDFIENMPGNGRVILLGRENISPAFLPLLWGRRLEIIPQRQLAFSKEEVRRIGEMYESSLDADEVWKFTGGWAGCVDLMFRLAGKCGENETVSVEDLRKRYEIDTYIETCIVKALSDAERELLDKSQSCPWISAELCQELWGVSDAKCLLEQMAEKGFLIYNKKKGNKNGYWKIARLFDGFRPENVVDMVQLGQWYEKNHHIKEALFCYGKIKWEADSPEGIFLRGMQCYVQHDFEGLDLEIGKLKKMQVQDEFQKAEILINLCFAKPDFVLNEWMTMVEAWAKQFEHTGKKFRLYNILWKSCTYLCGLRDLTGLFACTKKEENRNARIWKNAFGEAEWNAYLLARMDYYLETERKELLRDEDWAAFHSEETDDLVKMYLYGKLQRIFQDEEYEELYKSISCELLNQENEADAKVAEAFVSIHSPWLGEAERLTRWLKYSESEAKAEINEENYCVLWCMAKGYLMLNQYRKAEKILNRLIPYLQMYHRTKFLAEALYQLAIINWERGSRGLALQNMIESFYVSGDARYVGFYISYGKRGKEVLEAYEEWNRTTFPESWTRKKKYQYGNVLRMPMADYIGVILRLVRREARTNQLFQLPQEESVSEHLTMMETIILQDIGRGLTNGEICIEQNLKLATVKTHIYSLYKKLGVNSRVQATLKGKELGILE